MIREPRGRLLCLLEAVFKRELDDPGGYGIAADCAETCCAVSRGRIGVLDMIKRVEKLRAKLKAAAPPARERQSLRETVRSELSWLGPRTAPVLLLP